MRKDTVPPRPKDMMESLTPEQRQAIFQKAKQVEKSARKIEALNQGSKTLQQTKDIIPTGYGISLSAKQIQEKEQASQLEAQAKKQEQIAQQKKLVKRTAQGTVKKAITTEYGTFDYEASPEESKILELGGQEANDLLVKIANYYRDEFKKQNVPIKESRKGFADLWEAGLNPESVDVQGQLRTNLKETFAPYTPLLPRLALEKVAGALGSKGQELLQSENMAAKGAGLVTSMAGSIAEDLSNPLATFAYDTGNLYDPTATAEERGGAAFNVVAKYALPAMTPLGAAQAGINAFKAGQTVEQALSTASRVLLRSSLGALGKKIDTAVYSKVPLNKLLDVLEAEGQMMGKTRAALSKELAIAGKKYAKETGKGVDEFYTKYLNDYADNKAQLTSPGRVPPPIIEPAKAPEAPTQAEDLGTVVDDLVGKTEPVPAPTPEPTVPVIEPPVVQEPVVQITETNRQRYNAVADADDAWLEEYFTRKMDSRQAGFNLDDYEAMARMARSFAIKYGYNTIDDAIQLVVKAWKQRTGIDINLTDADTQAIKQFIAKLESNAPPVEPPTSIVDEIEQGMGASKSTAPPPPTEPTVTGIPETPEPITSGISNKANLSSEELGLISEAPQGKGRSASQVVEETINRNPSDKELEILAGKVANGQALNADDTAVLLVGQGRFNLRVFNAREALDNAIKSGASAQDIDQLRDAWLLAQADATNFAKQIQRGKSGWSDVGRVLQQKTDLFTGELSQIKANIIAEAELRKGRTLTDAEQENYKTMIDKLIGENKKLEEELAKLKATRSQATGEGRVRRTRTLDNLDKSIAQKENKIRVNKATVTQKLNNEIPVATSTRLGQFITEYKLLNPFSRLTDFASNVVKLVDNIATTPVARLIDLGTSKVLKSEPIYRTSYLSKDRWKNLLMNSFEKMKADIQIVASGGDVETIEKFGGAQGIGSKFAGFTDVPFKAIYHEDGKFLAADVKAREMLAEELGKGNFGKRDIDAKRTEILENIDQHPDIIMNAEEYALNETFNNHNWVSKINQRLKSGMSPASKATYDEAIGRFSKVITNVAIDVADRTGLGVARGIYNIADAIKSGKNLTTAERMTINKMITKGMVGMPLMYLGIKNWDKIEGEIRGVQQKYIDYGDLGKLGGPIAIFLHGASIGRAMNTLPEDKVNAFIVATTARLPFNTPFINNLKDIIEVVTNPNPKTLATFGAKKASNLLIMPFIKELANRKDTEIGWQTGMEPEREKYPEGASTAEIFKGEFMSKIPGLRQQLPLKGSGRQPVTPGVIP